MLKLCQAGPFPDDSRGEFIQGFVGIQAEDAPMVRCELHGHVLLVR